MVLEKLSLIRPDESNIALLLDYALSFLRYRTKFDTLRFEVTAFLDTLKSSSS